MLLGITTTTYFKEWIFFIYINMEISGPQDLIFNYISINMTCTVFVRICKLLGQLGSFSILSVLPKTGRWYLRLLEIIVTALGSLKQDVLWVCVVGMRWLSFVIKNVTLLEQISWIELNNLYEFPSYKYRHFFCPSISLAQCTFKCSRETASLSHILWVDVWVCVWVGGLVGLDQNIKKKQNTCSC